MPLAPKDKPLSGIYKLSDVGHCFVPTCTKANKRLQLIEAVQVSLVRGSLDPVTLCGPVTEGLGGTAAPGTKLISHKHLLPF